MACLTDHLGQTCCPRGFKPKPIQSVHVPRPQAGAELLRCQKRKARKTQAFCASCGVCKHDVVFVCCVPSVGLRKAGWFSPRFGGWSNFFFTPPSYTFSAVLWTCLCVSVWRQVHLRRRPLQKCLGGNNLEGAVQRLACEAFLGSMFDWAVARRCQKLNIRTDQVPDSILWSLLLAPRCNKRFPRVRW